MHYYFSPSLVQRLSRKTKRKGESEKMSLPLELKKEKKGTNALVREEECKKCVHKSSNQFEMEFKQCNNVFRMSTDISISIISDFFSCHFLSRFLPWMH